MTVDEIRARYSDLRNCDTQIWRDFDYLLKENERLRTALGELLALIRDRHSIWTGAYEGHEIVVVIGPKNLDLFEPESWCKLPYQTRAVVDYARKALLPNNAILTQSERNSDAIAAEES